MPDAVFSDVTVYGAIFVGVIALVAQMTGNTVLTDFLDKSPVVGVAAALGIGALIDLLGGALYALLLRGRLDGTWRDEVAETLPSYNTFTQRMSLPHQGTTASRAAGSREHAVLVTEYEFRRTAPAPLIDWVMERRARHRFLALVTGTVFVATNIAFWFAGRDSLVAPLVFGASLFALGLGWGIASSRIAAEGSVQERWLRDLAANGTSSGEPFTAEPDQRSVTGGTGPGKSR